MTQPAQYLYCIITGGEPRNFDAVSAIGDAAAPVHTVSHNGLAAVVSDSPAKEYAETRTNLLAHQRVQERVMEEATLLPVRFGTVASTATPNQDIQRLLRKRSGEFEELLAELEGKVEVGIKALWRDEGRLFQNILNENPRIKRLRAALEAKSPQATYFERLRLGELVKKALDQKRRAEAARILAPLHVLARRSEENPIVVDRMILNVAFLVDKSQEEAFDQMVSALDQELSEAVVLKYVGPVPPYNFVNITVNWQEV